MKKVIIKIKSEEVNIEDVNKNKIYAFYHKGFNEIYKLQQIQNLISFVCINNSDNYYSKIKNDTFKYAINLRLIDNQHIIYEFDNVKEFLEWSLEVIRK